MAKYDLLNVKPLIFKINTESEFGDLEYLQFPGGESLYS